MISLLVAMDRQHVIGANGDLPWRLPNDLKFFKEKTIGHTIIMGRKTYESIGKPLSKRRNVVITSQNDGFPDEVKVIRSLDTIKDWHKENPDEELFVIGGGNIFNQILPDADRMYITFIDEEFEGDTYFPGFSEDEWVLTDSQKGEKNDKNPYDYYFQQYDRK
ncbi:dihydrofolate reductase [Virgibacillus kekensis]|uniref:Dihydrofolate reductase n=1 Tax=Virgibacillus kekensis TaxID=202261 RepID=A0ABV9DEV0_9BACI